MLSDLGLYTLKLNLRTLDCGGSDQWSCWLTWGFTDGGP
jgi:hypothetical protein